MLTQALVQELFNYNPETGILTNKIARGQRAKIGDDSGYVSGGGYLHIGINGKKYLAHRICFLHYHGHLPEKVDHKDNNKLNNEILNLRKCTAQQNSFNAKISKANSSGVKGVHWHRSTKKWRAVVMIDGKNNHLGLFADIEDASKAVENARIHRHGEFANNG